MCKRYKERIIVNSTHQEQNMPEELHSEPPKSEQSLTFC